MTYDELKNTVIGKKLSECADINFSTCYPLVARDAIDNPDAEVIGIVCAEFGSRDEEWGKWDTDGNVAWPVDDDDNS